MSEPEGPDAGLLPATVHASFLVAATDLGMWSAANLFCRELSAEGGDALLAALRDELGRDFPVLDGVVATWGGSGAGTPARAELLAEALDGVDRLVIAGFEADALDALAAWLPASVEIGVLTGASVLEPDWHTALSNFARPITELGLGEFQRWAGRRSALLTFVYGSDHAHAYVDSAWMRVHAPDVRVQFRALVGWNLLERPLDLYPRWLSQTSVSDFSLLVGP